MIKVAPSKYIIKKKKKKKKKETKKKTKVVGSRFHRDT